MASFALSRILAPVAFSPACHAAGRFAAALAARFGSELTFLHVVERLDHWLSLESTPVLTELSRIRRQWVVREIHALLDDCTPNVKTNTAVVEGDPAREIVRIAHEHKADLIVMPSHGHGQFRRLLLGSVTAKVLHDAGCPVWTGAHMEDSSIPNPVVIRKIVCGIDLGPHSGSVIGWAAGMADNWAAELVVVHAAPHPDQGAHDQIERLLRDAGTHAEVRVESGEMPKAICDAVRSESADLLVIGRGHGPTGAGRLPSKTYAILRGSPCPVVSV
jgi:nucleotide-binding universal stress UspA family protein